MRNLILSVAALTAAAFLTTAQADPPKAKKTEPPAAAVPMSTTSAPNSALPPGTLLVSADAYNALLTVYRAMTELNPELATQQAQKAFQAMVACAQDNLSAPTSGDGCPIVTAGLAKLRCSEPAK